MAQRAIDRLKLVFSLALVACQKDKANPAPPPEPREVEHLPLPIEVTSATPPRREMGPKRAPDERDRLLRDRCTGSAIVEQLHPAVPVDYLELRVDKPSLRTYQVLGSRGEPCTRATTPADCQEDLKLTRQPRAVTERAKPDDTRDDVDLLLGYFVYTRGDEVGAVSGNDIPAFLAPIENTSEAAIVQFFDAEIGDFKCDPSQFHRAGNGFVATQSEKVSCATNVFEVVVTRSGNVERRASQRPELGCVDVPIKRVMRGRRAEGDDLPAFADQGTLASFFDDCAEMEATSVHAFHVLEADLARLNGPRSLRSRARRSANDETRHARTMRRLARRFGSTTPARRRPTPQARARSPLAIATENAIVGCVEETWAALLATWQAEHATDPTIRAAHVGIARDETRHAALAWDVAAWLETQLDEREREEVRAARTRAVHALRATIERSPLPAFGEAAGLPSADDSARMFDVLSEIWSLSCSGR